MKPQMLAWQSQVSKHKSSDEYDIKFFYFNLRKVQFERASCFLKHSTYI